MQKIRREKVCLSTIEPRINRPTNNNIDAASQKYPGLIFKFGYIALGEDGPGKVSELHSRGFKGLKALRPPDNYDEKNNDPLTCR